MELSAYLRFAEKSVGQLFVQAESDAGSVNIQIESAVSVIIETTSVLILSSLIFVLPSARPQQPHEFLGPFDRRVLQSPLYKFVAQLICVLPNGAPG